MPGSDGRPVVSLTFGEPEELQHLSVATDAEMLFVSGTRRGSQIVVAALGDLSLQWSLLSGTFFTRGAIAPPRCAFLIPVAGPGPAIWNGHALHRDQFAGWSPGAEYTATAPAPSADLAVCASRDAFARVFGPLLGVPDWMPNQGCSLYRSESPAMTRLREVAAVALDVCRTTPELLDAIEARLGLSHAIYGALAAAILAARPVPSAVAPGLPHSRIVQLADEYLRHHLDEPIYISQLCVATGVSERTLRTAFYDVYRTSPTRYLQTRRLHQVRRALRHADPTRSTVTAVATQYGFWELGRFAGAYKTLFGEAPSKTLNRRNSRSTHPRRNADMCRNDDEKRTST